MFWVVTRQKLELCLCVVLLMIACITAVIDGGSMQQEIAPASTGVREIPIYSVATDERRVALTFDAAAGASDTDALLGILAAHDIKATFFLCGCWVRNHPNETRKIMNAGHEIGNHGDEHLDPVKLSKQELIAEIENQSQEIQRLLGIQETLYRPALGSYNTEVIRTAKELGFDVIQWSVDSLDWKNLPCAEIVERVAKRVKPGSIILFHNGAKNTPEALPQVIEKLQAEGYRFVKASELIHKENYTIDHNGKQIAQ